MADDPKPTDTGDPRWLSRIKVSGPYAVAVAVGVLIAEGGNLADAVGKIYDRFKIPEAFVLAETSAKSAFSDQLAQRAWRRLFWADNFRARVANSAPLADIDASWKSYIDADADWNANVMIAIVGIDKYYGARRSADLENNIQDLFRQLDNELATLRRSDLIKALQAGQNPTAEQTTDAKALSDRVGKTSDALKTQLYILVRCFAPGSKDTNLCS